MRAEATGLLLDEQYVHHSLRLVGYASDPGSIVDFVALEGYDRGYHHM